MLTALSGPGGARAWRLAFAGMACKRHMRSSDIKTFRKLMELKHNAHLRPNFLNRVDWILNEVSRRDVNRRTIPAKYRGTTYLCSSAKR